MIGERSPNYSGADNEFKHDQVVIAETSIDNMNPEFFGFVMDRLFEEGALDVVWIPIQMKKNRPGTMLQVICTRERLNSITRCILTETTSLGVRYYEANRHLLERDHVTLDSPSAEFRSSVSATPGRGALCSRIRGLPAHRSRKRRSSQDRIRRRFKGGVCARHRGK